MFKGKVAIVTGCAQGIGKATAVLLAKGGASLMINDLTPKIEEFREELLGMGCDVISYRCDISDYDEVGKLVEKTVEHFGKIDILINTVALPHRKKIMDTPKEEFDRVINVNLKAIFYPCKHVIPHMIEQRYGRIVNISSVAGIRGGGFLGMSTYACSKGGVISLTKGIAREVAEYGITCNVVCPGFTMTSRNENESPEAVQRVLNMIPLHKYAQPEEIAHTIVHLASDNASFITGATYIVDGGATMY